MKIVIDNHVLRVLVQHPTLLMENLLLANSENEIRLRWPTLLDYLELDSIFASLPIFDESHPVFVACVKTLYANEDKEVLFYLYDQLFAECLNQIKNLPQINAPFLLQAMHEKQDKPMTEEVKKMLSPALAGYKAILLNNPHDTLHNLILYLAWDRMCMNVARLFNYQSTDPKFIHGLAVLKECLVESYQHITGQGRTFPSLYRMIESLFFYQMREEHLQTHTESEWALLSQIFPLLQAEDKLADVYYIDDALTLEGQVSRKHSDNTYLTLDSPQNVQSKLALAQYVIAKLKTEIPQWNFILEPTNIVHL